MLETTLNTFPPETEDFVTHDVLNDYIQDTAVKTGVHSITRYDTLVKKVEKKNAKWSVETTTLQHTKAGHVFRQTGTSVSQKQSVF